MCSNVSSKPPPTGCVNAVDQSGDPGRPTHLDGLRQTASAMDQNGTYRLDAHDAQPLDYFAVRALLDGAIKS